MEINLIPPKLKEAKKQAEKAAYLCFICVSLLGLFFYGLFVLEIADYILSRHINTLTLQTQSENQELNKLRKIEEKAKSLNESLKMVEGLITSRVSWSEILSQLFALVPKSLQINGLSLKAEGASSQVSLSGQAANLEDIVAFKEKIEGSPFFKSPELSAISQTGSNEKKSYSFSLTFLIEKRR